MFRGTKKVHHSMSKSTREAVYTVVGIATFLNPALLLVPALAIAAETAFDAAKGTVNGAAWLARQAAERKRQAAEEAERRRRQEEYERKERERAAAKPTVDQMVEAAQAEFAYWVSIWSAMPLEPEDLKGRINEELDRLDAKLRRIRG